MFLLHFSWRWEFWVCCRLLWPGRKGLRVVLRLLSLASKVPRLRPTIRVKLMTWLALHWCCGTPKLIHLWWVQWLLLCRGIKRDLRQRYRGSGLVRICLRLWVWVVCLVHRDVVHMLHRVIRLFHCIVMEDSGRISWSLLMLPRVRMRGPRSCWKGDVRPVGARTEVEVGLFEDHALIVSIAKPFAFHAVPTYRSSLIALYATFAARQTSSLRSLPRQSCSERSFSRSSIWLAGIVAFEIAGSICTFGRRHGEMFRAPGSRFGHRRLRMVVKERARAQHEHSPAICLVPSPKTVGWARYEVTCSSMIARPVARCSDERLD